MSKNFHGEPFSEETILKLDLFEKYMSEWLPVFLKVSFPWSSQIYVYDFFAGPGRDRAGILGSPLRILEEISKQTGNIFSKNKTIRVFFNEYEKEKEEQLEKSCGDYVEKNNDLRRLKNSGNLKLEYMSASFDVAFEHKRKEIADNCPALVFLDQCGVKFLTDEYLGFFTKAKRTDFLYFLASSYFLRFECTDEFGKIINDLGLNFDQIKSNPYRAIHADITKQLKRKYKDARLYPFSIKKGTNIYGVIFGSSHPLAIEKFLTLAWNENPINGEANFDLYDDVGNSQVDLFEGVKISKVELFQKELREKILRKEILNNKDAYAFCLERGHIGKHAKEEILRMRKGGLISYSGVYPKVTYDSVVKNKSILPYIVK